MSHVFQRPSLGGKVAVARGLGGEPGTQCVPCEVARVKCGDARTPLDDQRDRLGGEGVGDRSGACDGPRERTARQVGVIDPRAYGAHGAGVRGLAVGEQEGMSLAGLVRL